MWAEALRQKNPQEWDNIVAMMKATPELWVYVRRYYPALGTDDAIAEEALAQFSGRRGHEKLMAFAEGQTDSRSILQMVEAALEKFWHAVADFLHIHYETKEQVADQILTDLLKGVNPILLAREGEAVDQTETQAFKEWFGDWQNNPGQASKMVDKEGKPLVVYHGSYWDPLAEEPGKAVFDHSYQGVASTDNGFFGNGFYFTFGGGESSRLEARTYGPKVGEYFLNIRNPFMFCETLKTFKDTMPIGDEKNSVMILNMVKHFPEFAKNYQLDVFNDMGEQTGEISLEDYAKKLMDVYENKEFIIHENVDPRDSNIIELCADPVVHQDHYADGTPFEWTEYGFQMNLYRPSERDDAQLAFAHYYLTEDSYRLSGSDGRKEWFGVHYNMFHYLFESEEFTNELKARGYDGVMQSEDGDEVVVFDANQIKSASANLGTFYRNVNDVRMHVVAPEAPLTAAEEVKEEKHEKTYCDPAVTEKIHQFVDLMKKYGSEHSYPGQDGLETSYTKKERYSSEFKLFEEIARAIRDNDPKSYRSEYDILSGDRTFCAAQVFYTDETTGVGYQLYRKPPTYRGQKAQYYAYVYQPQTLENRIAATEKSIEKMQKEYDAREARMKNVRGHILEDMKAENAALKSEIDRVSRDELKPLLEEKARLLPEAAQESIKEIQPENEKPQAPAQAAKPLTAADREAGSAMVDHLEAMGIEVHTDARENRRVLKEAQKDQSEAGKIRHMKTENGMSYGFSYKGEIHLDLRKIDAELPLHEYAHLWCEAMRRINPDNWKAVVDVMKNDADTWQYVSKVYPELKDDNDLAEEVIAHYSGKRGAEKLQAELQRMSQRDDSYKGKWGNIFQNVSKAIQDFWKHIGDSLNIHYVSKEDIADQILNDFARKVSPVRKVENWLEQRDKAYADAVAKGDMDKARDLFWEALNENVGNGITPFMGVDGYRGKLDRLARDVKDETNTEAISKAADLMAPYVRAGMVLVPAPGHEGYATHTLALANAISERSHVPVADVLVGVERERQYDVKKATGKPIPADQLGIRMVGELPQWEGIERMPVVIDNVVHSGNTAEACVKALGKGVVLSLASAVSQERHVASLKSFAPVVYDKNDHLIPLSKRFEFKNGYLGKVMHFKPVDFPEKIAGLEGYTTDEVLKYVREHFESVLDGMDTDVRIVDMKVIGSRVKGDYDEDSDLDVLLEYEGDFREDTLFNILNDEDEGRLYIEGIPVDINPITRGKSGTIQEFLERNASYDKSVDKVKNNSISQMAKIVYSIKADGEGSNRYIVTFNESEALKVSQDDQRKMALGIQPDVQEDAATGKFSFVGYAAAERFGEGVMALDRYNTLLAKVPEEDAASRRALEHDYAVVTKALSLERGQNALADDLLKLWLGDGSPLKGDTVQNYFQNIFKTMFDNKDLHRQFEQLQDLSDGSMRELAWFMAYKADGNTLYRVMPEIAEKQGIRPPVEEEKVEQQEELRYMARHLRRCSCGLWP